MSDRFGKLWIPASLLRFGRFSLRFSQNNTIKAITDGLVNIIPLVLIGTICIALSQLPIPEMHDFLNSITNDYWTLIANMIIFCTEHIIGLASLLSVSYSFALQNDTLSKRSINRFLPVFTAFSCYVILLAWDPVSYMSTPASQTPELHFNNPGYNGVFFAILIAVSTSKLFNLFALVWQKLPWYRKRVVGSYTQIRNAIHAVVPILLCLFSFITVRILLDLLFSTVDIEDKTTAMITQIARDGHLGSVILTVLMIQTLWFFGAHGSHTLRTLMEFVNPITSSNTAQLATSQSMSVEKMFTSWDFYGTFIEMGGTGTTMALLLALLVFGYVGRERLLGRISILPVAFNVNETLVFGIPIVFNPFYLIPFILAPVISASVSYLAFALGIVPPIINSVEWTIPVFCSGYLATGSIAGLLLQVVCLSLSFLIYAPFVITARISLEQYQTELFDSFRRDATLAANNEMVFITNRSDAIGAMANQFVTEIKMSLDNQALPFFLVYQPKSDKSGKVVGAEALLRWTHPLYGPIPPDIVIELTDEADLSVQLGRWVLSTALEEFARWQERGLTQLILSINLNPNHIVIDAEFPEFVKSELDRLSIDASQIDLEITEHAAVGANQNMLDMFHRLREIGLRLSIDDMGMGYSSLTYISDFGASVVKIDISLIDQVSIDFKQQEIVRSIVDLAKQINLSVIVEGVETEEQVEVLDSLGCRYYQGYYFAKPLLPEDFLTRIEEHGMAVMHGESSDALKL